MIYEVCMGQEDWQGLYSTISLMGSPNVDQIRLFKRQHTPRGCPYDP